MVEAGAAETTVGFWRLGRSVEGRGGALPGAEGAHVNGWTLKER